MENTEQTKLENVAQKSTPTEISEVVEDKINNAVDGEKNTVENVILETENHNEITGIVNGVATSKINGILSSDEKDIAKVDDISETLKNEAKQNFEIKSSVIEVAMKVINDVCEQSKINVQERVNMQTSLDNSVEKETNQCAIEESTQNKNQINLETLKDETIVPNGTVDSTENKSFPQNESKVSKVDTTNEVNVSPLSENIFSNGVAEVQTLESNVEEQNVQVHEYVDIPNGVHSIEEQVDNGEEELNSDDAINTVIKDIIDALQTTTNTEILCPPTDTKPPQGFISEMDWKMRETALLVKIAKLEEDERIKQEALQIKLKMKCDENEILKAKLKTLDTELRAVCSKPNSKNKDMVSKIKKQHDDLLTKARGMIFEKTKMIKNQELRIEALTTQVASLKDMVAITKDMLNIRNMECKHLQDRMETMDLRLQAEKERQNLMAKKLESGNKLNESLKVEYLKQMDLFKHLKVKYEEKFDVLERNQKDPTEESTNSQQ